MISNESKCSIVAMAQYSAVETGKLSARTSFARSGDFSKVSRRFLYNRVKEVSSRSKYFSGNCSRVCPFSSSGRPARRGDNDSPESREMGLEAQ